MVREPQQQEFQVTEYFAFKAKRQRVMNADTQITVFFFFSLNKVQVLDSGNGAEWAGIPTSKNTSKVVSHSHSQEPVSQVIPNLLSWPSKLTITIYQASWKRYQ